MGAEHGRAQLPLPGTVAGVQPQHADLGFHQPGRQFLEVGHGAPADYLAARPGPGRPGAPLWQPQ